jgi:hypothetical protein
MLSPQGLVILLVRSMKMPSVAKSGLVVGVLGVQLFLVVAV